MDYIKLSKTVSYILRHHPEEYGIILDLAGWCQIEVLLKVLNQRGWKNLVSEDLVKMMSDAQKKRYEVQDGRIRAYYGHSMSDIIVKEACEPPQFLYHGTAHDKIELIKETGLRPMTRQYVHLSDNITLAQIVGKRHDSCPIIIRVCAKKAWQEGICFYLGNEDTWLSDSIPPEFLELDNQ